MTGHRLALAVLAALPAAVQARAQDPVPPAAVADTALRAELLRMRTEDQAGRDRIAEAVAAKDTMFIKSLMARDSALTRRLRAIVARHGWPGRALVGADGAEAAWLVLQHSPELGFQREMLPRIWEAARAGEGTLAEAAMLEDRIRVASGEPQRYGTSFAIEPGELRPHPIADLEGLAARRREVGLPPIEEYVKQLAEVYRVPVRWPPQ